jgi:hypothetical protein
MRAAECCPGRKSGVGRNKRATAPLGAAQNEAILEARKESVTRFAGSMNILESVTPGLRPGLHAAAISDGSLSDHVNVMRIITSQLICVICG